ncbi:something about silencing protein 10 [Astyanax mexicanus]|uniref:something about silencing protein 10 n=1 Tax=Astyanax mexicanus TaxID=7994 RepID=UPI0020CAEB2E|nr:something about silencing protein 10 [Astyanax mexicanus]
MVRAKRTVRRPRVKRVEEYDSDDPAKYKNEDVPDKKSLKYTEDKVDEFHNKTISKLLARGVRTDNDYEDEADEEEVMPLTLQDSDDDEDDEEEDGDDGDEEGETDMESDLEGKKDDDLPNAMAWGSRKNAFYDSDYTTTKKKSLVETEAEDKEEEEEAKSIQRRLAANLSEEDYDLNLLQEFAVEAEDEQTEESGEKQQRIEKDLDQMSQKEKLKLLKKESPELLELINDFKTKLSELKDEIQPLVQMVKDGKIPAGKGANYLITKQQLYLNYCTNISFYLVLKAKRIPAHNHPVIERLVTYRNLINELAAVDAKLAPQLRELLSGHEQERRLTKSKQTSRSKVSEAVGVEEAESSDSDEEAALRFYKGIEARLKLKRKNKDLQDGGLSTAKEDQEEEAEMDGDAKRGITYQMAKNKGLTAKRKKIDRNPRVKHREKYRRAKIRRKGQVREVMREETRYSGELSGIRAGVKKSIKLK